MPAQLMVKGSRAGQCRAGQGRAGQGMAGRHLEMALLHHTVCFIQHKESQVGHVRQVCVPLLHQLPQPPRSGHHHLHQLSHLTCHTQKQSVMHVGAVVICHCVYCCCMQHDTARSLWGATHKYRPVTWHTCSIVMSPLQITLTYHMLWLITAPWFSTSSHAWRVGGGGGGGGGSCYVSLWETHMPTGIKRTMKVCSIQKNAQPITWLSDRRPVKARQLTSGNFLSRRSCLIGEMPPTMGTAQIPHTLPTRCRCSQTCSREPMQSGKTPKRQDHMSV